MATGLFLQIKGVKYQGTQSKNLVLMEGINSSNGDLFPIGTMQWGAIRGVSMDVGNMQHADSGMAAFNEITITKSMCGASEDIRSMLLEPGDEGSEVRIFQVGMEPKASSNKGTTFKPKMQIFLEQARMAHYSLSVKDGGLPEERLALAYTVIHIKLWNTTGSGGGWKPGGEVAFDLSTGKVISAIKPKG
ncbi:type VI secretion system tube protein Hcp [Endozoicomonadaceae bacterium StTr2]